MDEIEVVAYDPGWPQLFKDEARRLRERLGLDVNIEHVGSTSIPGLSAKPVIDIMIGIQDLAAAAPIRTGLHGLGYEYWQDDPAQSERMFFIRWSDDQRFRLSQVHVTAIGSAFWTELLAFRDALRANSSLASEYEHLKLDLAERHRLDREAYTAAKTEFVRRITRPA